MRLAVVLVLGLALGIAPPAAEAQECRVVDVDFLPSENLQIVVWLESSAGQFIDTLYITQLTGTYGLGNRPGIIDFNSAWRWPYGRRENTFPVWAHRHGLSFPRLEFQNLDDDNLSHPFAESSAEGFFCRPLMAGETAWDSQTCASVIYTDKGAMSQTETSLYPPREDITRKAGTDDLSVDMFDNANPFDAVSRATPSGGTPYQIAWPIPESMATGEYVLWVEVSEENDFNDTYNQVSYPAPTNIPWADYGVPYRGQPSVIYRVPFTIGTVSSTSTVDTYHGYGDILGADGMVRSPDATIETGTPGSGASRLLLTMGDSEMYRVRVEARPEFDLATPSQPSQPAVDQITSRSAHLSFNASGDDDLVGRVTGYEIRYRAAVPITEENFDDSTLIGETVTPLDPGLRQNVDIAGLLPQTNYYIGIRAFDDCQNRSPLSVVHFETDERETGEVDACFIATAAYGSLLANDVTMLRRFRDGVLRRTALGELLVETYYTLGPAAAGVVDQSEELRGAAREALSPLVGWARGLSY